jgi:hypothetical protein
MSAVMKEFDDSKDRMRSENSKLSESINAVTDEMSISIEISNKNLSGGLKNNLEKKT